MQTNMCVTARKAPKSQRMTGPRNTRFESYPDAPDGLAGALPSAEEMDRLLVPGVQGGGRARVRGGGEREREREREEEDLKMPNATNSHSTGSHHRAHTARLRTRLNIKELENNANAPKI